MGIQPIARFISRFIYTEYAEAGVYGMSNGLPITSMAVPILFLIIIFSFRHSINFADRKEKVWYFSFIVYFIISVAALRVEMMQWLSFYFYGYNFLFIPKLLKKQTKYKTNIWGVLIIALFTAYSLFSSFAEWQYRFFWM